MNAGVSVSSLCLSRFPSISPPHISLVFLWLSHALFRLAGTGGCAVRSWRGRRSGLCACGWFFWGAAGQCLCASFSAGRHVAFCHHPPRRRHRVFSPSAVTPPPGGRGRSLESGGSVLGRVLRIAPRRSGPVWHAGLKGLPDCHPMPSRRGSSQQGTLTMQRQKYCCLFA